MISRPSKLVLVAVFSLLGLAPAHDARGNTVQDMLGQGARAKAMGGTGTASSSDSSATYYNPAGLGDCPGNEVSIDLSHLVYGLDVESEDERAEQGTLHDRSSMTIAGCVQLPARLHAGFLFDTGLQSAQRLDQGSLRSTPEYALYGNAFEQVSMMAGLGMRVNKRLSLGLGGALLVNSGLGVGISVPIIDGQEELGSEIQWKLKPAAALYAGVVYRPSETLRLGASFRSALFHKLEADVLTTVDVAGVLLDVDLLLESVAWYSPLQASLGVAYESGPALVSADLTWYHWSAYPGPFMHLSPLDPEDSIAASLNYPPNEAPNFSDTFVPRLGAEVPLTPTLLLRSGLAYQASPAPTPKGRANLLDASVATASLGLGYRYLGGTVSLYTRLHYMREREVQKQITDEPDLLYRFGGTMFDLGLALSSSW